MDNGDEVTHNAESLRPLGRDSRRLGSLDLFSRLATGGASGELLSTVQIEEFLDDVRSGLLDAAASAGTLHGWRVQSLFRGVVVALDSIKLIKDEDAGDALHGLSEIAVPDFRVVTDSGDQLLIEVKNASQKTPTSDYSMRAKDLDGLQAYSDLVKTPLRVALYWWKWNLWSLVDPGALTADGAKYRITLPEAMMANEMSGLGDRSLGTEYPLQFRLTADPTVSREVGDDGSVDFTVGDAQLLVDNRVIFTDSEKQIAWNLMLHGGWEEDAVVADVDDDGLLRSVTFELRPAHENRDKPFALHQPMSSMFSSYFNQRTLSDDGAVRSLDAPYDPGQMSNLVREPYDGEVLRLWRFTIRGGKVEQ